MGGDSFPVADTDRAAVRSSRLRVAALVALLPLFGQTFHYMKDLPPLWALSKVFPIISLPLALPLFARERLPLLSGWLGAFLWLVLVSSFIGIFTFDQDMLRGLTAQVKLLPMLYVFSFLGYLLLLRPTVQEIGAAFLWCAALTFLVLVVLWAFAPQSWYISEYQFGDAPLLSADDRGNRIRMPMYFGMIALFALFRNVSARRDLRSAILIVIILAIIVGIVRTRALVLATLATLAVIAFQAASPRRRIAVVIAAGLIGLVLLQIPYVSSVFDTTSASGFDVRWTTIVKAREFLGDSVWRWLFGVGTISSLDPAGLPRFFNHFFFLADIAWLGIIFEFGLIGAGLILFLLVRTFVFAQGVSRSIDAPILFGLRDYVLFTILISSVYSTMTLQPGEIAVIAATMVYCWLLARPPGSVGLR